MLQPGDWVQVIKPNRTVPDSLRYVGTFGQVIEVTTGKPPYYIQLYDNRWYYNANELQKVNLGRWSYKIGDRVVAIMDSGVKCRHSFPPTENEDEYCTPRFAKGWTGKIVGVGTLGTQTLGTQDGCFFVDILWDNGVMIYGVTEFSCILMDRRDISMFKVGDEISIPDLGISSTAEVLDVIPEAGEVEGKSYDSILKVRLNTRKGTIMTLFDFRAQLYKPTKFVISSPDGEQKVFDEEGLSQYITRLRQQGVILEKYTIYELKHGYPATMTYRRK